MTIQPPPSHALTAEVAAVADEYNELRARHTEAQSELGVLIAGRDAARLADAATLSDTARNHGDISKVGTPAQTALNTRIEQQQTVVTGLSHAIAAAETELRAALRQHGDACLAVAIANVEQMHQPYLKAISDLQALASAYDAALFTLAGFVLFIDSGKRDIHFGTVGSVALGGNQWLEPINLVELTRTLRGHAGRAEQIKARIGVDAARRAADAAAAKAQSDYLQQQQPRPVTMPEPRFDEVTGDEVYVGL